jgi:hypothetical protein
MMIGGIKKRRSANIFNRTFPNVVKSKSSCKAERTKRANKNTPIGKVIYANPREM